MDKSITPKDGNYRALIALHAARHAERGAERVAAEVRDYLRRAAGLAPDARSASDGGLTGVTPGLARDAYALASRTLTDITALYPPKKF